MPCHERRRASDSADYLACALLLLPFAAVHTGISLMLYRVDQLLRIHHTGNWPYVILACVIGTAWVSGVAALAMAVWSRVTSKP